MMKDIYLIRHGKTAGNKDKRYVGSTDESLCEAGIYEINERRNTLLRSFSPENETDGMSQISTAYKGNILPHKVYVSPMLRCRQTADLLFPGVEQEVVVDFREMHFGQFEYKNYEELAGDERYQAFIDSGGRTDFPEAEPQLQFRQRVRKAFAQCLENHKACMSSVEPREPLVFVVHGGTIMAIMEEYARPHRDYFDWQVHPVSGYCCRIVWDEGRFYLDDVIEL